MRTLALVAVIAVAACATNKGASSDAPKEERQKISNITYYDIASCVTPSPALPDKLNKESVIGAALFARPAVLECFTDPKNRGSAAETTANVKVTVDESGAKYEVTGTNLTPAGTDCVKAQMEKLPLKALGKGEAAISADVPFRHGGNSPAVKMGLNAGSDAVGTIRLAEAQWCECYAPLETKPPPSVTAHVKMLSTGTNDFKFDAATGDAQALIECITPKMKALKLTAFNNDFNFDYPVLLINSLATGETPEAKPELQFIQLDAIRAARAANVAMKVSVRNTDNAAYDAAVQVYNKTKNTKMVKELKDKCAAMVKADQGWIDALKSQLELETHTAEVAGTLKAKDAQWGEAETASKKTADATKAEVTKAEGIKAADEKVCPKEHY
ncbi:MAG: hypothetical protein QM723_22460 [Myxococcaceae bacterium]